MFRAIVEAMARASVGDLDARVDVSGELDRGDPFVELALMLNVLLEDLEHRRRQSERALELAAAGEARQRFLATMSHEIRTPMTVMLGMATLLSDTELDERQRRWMDEALNAGHHLRSLIDDILDLSKVESGVLRFDRAPFDIRECVEESVLIVEHAARERGLELRSRFHGAGGRGAVGDAGRLRQVFVNLLGNAVRFTSEGSVELEVSTTASGDGRIRIDAAVTDTGVGIEPDRLAEVFEPFAQVDDAAPRDHGGTGLGLTISRTIVEAMGGSIGVTSQPGAGSTFAFHVVVPAPAPDRDVVEPRQGPEAGRSTLRVLVAEDNAAIQLLHETILSSLGCPLPAIASNGAEAVRLAEREAFDLVVMDMRMPELDGLEAARRIRRIEGRDPTREPALIVAITANALDSDRADCMAAGMDAFVSKPFGPDDVARYVDEAAARVAQRW